MQRFFLSIPLTPGSEIELPAEVTHQVVRVLRLRVGQKIVLVPDDGTELEAELLEVAGKQVRARVGEPQAPERELPHGLHVGLAALKGERLEWAVQKLTELGAARVSLLLTERTIVAAGEERWSGRMERYRRIAREAAEQSGRLRLPEIHEPERLAALLAESDEPLRFILDPYASEALTRVLPTDRSAVLGLVGPEGGFTEGEVALAKEAGFAGMRLGNRILRAETAAIAVGTLLADWLERASTAERSVL